MSTPSSVERLRLALQGPLPGHDGFLKQAGYKRGDIETSLLNDPAPRESAVLVLLFPHGTDLHTLLMVRPAYEGVHGGQVSFPGGKREEQDTDAWATALREFREETGIALIHHEPLGQLSRVYIPPSRMMVTPCVAFVQEIGAASPDPNEVDTLFDTPLAALLPEDAIKHREQYIHIAGRTTRVPYFELGGRVVWGATAMMLWELRELLRAGA